MTDIELSAVEDHDGILTIRGGGKRRDWKETVERGLGLCDPGAMRLNS